MVPSSAAVPALSPAQLVARAAAEAPDESALLVAGASVGWAELHDRCSQIAGGLVARGIQRFASTVADPQRRIELLIAASAAGVEACGYASGLGVDEVDSLRARFDHETIITDQSGAGVVGVDELLDADPVEPVGEGLAPLLVLTTGTTGLPKGARHDWRRLVANSSRWTSESDSRWLLTYNLNQFAGIQVLLHALCSRATLVVPENNQPRAALAAAVAGGVTHASATPTFWRFLLALIEDDTPVPPLRQITLGGEAVPADLVAKLAARFPDARTSQVYASTEFGTAASTTDTAAGLPLSVLERSDDAVVQFKIVDGELFARSSAGMLGYYGDDGDGVAEWSPTGDLVEIRGDRIHFTGRSVEIINVGGVKIHPLVVEERALAVDDVQFAHAYGRSNPIAGQIVTLDVVVGRDLSDDEEEEIEDKIRDSCSSLPDAAQPRRIRFVPELDVRENKVRRGGSK